MKFDDKEFLSGRIKYYRKKMKLTQAELAEKVELSEQHISRIEGGCYIPSLKSFFLIANILNMDLKEFGYNKEEVENPVKNLLIEKIRSADDIELMFYKNSIENVEKSFSELKENYHIFRNI